MLLPDRIIENVKNHLIYTLALLVIIIVGLPLFQTAFFVLWDGNIILSAIVVFLLIGFYYALPEKNRLDKNTEEMREFRKATPDGTYNAKDDAKRLIRSPEFWSDCVSILCLVIASIVIIVALIMFRVITPPALVKVLEDPFILLFIPPASVILMLVYGIFHLVFTVQVHNDWDATRLHLAGEKRQEFQYKK